MNTRSALALFLLIVFAGALPARAAPEPAPAPVLNEIYSALGVDAVAADHVVLVDVSGSLRGARYASLRRSLTRYFTTLAPEDFVTLIPFGGDATATTRQVGREPGSLTARLPAEADRPHTDIGAALEKAVTTLARSGAPPLATVLLLTDGPHDPGPGSAYPLTRGNGWNVLARRAAGLDKTSLAAYAVPLSGGTGADLLTKVFPHARVLAPTPADRLTTPLARAGAAARAAKARTLLTEEITLPVTVSWPLPAGGAGRTIAAVRVESPMPHVPLILENVSVSSDNPSVSVRVPSGPAELPPGREITLPVTIDWNAGPVALAPRRTVRDRVTLRLSATVSSPWTPVLTGDLGLTPRFALAAAPGERELTAQRGSLWRWLGALLLTVLLVAALLVPALHRRHSTTAHSQESIRPLTSPDVIA
ncbi:VWA domain containing CoxE-like protein [Actinoplanes derwentensis]|uniref:VWA domain containing CoxE-like protein n=1 Tax=Actinoplanes derwentensis TaxID=113562 RepID=A0A1H2DEI3_9ACTN|nr:hypothetical protein Ade03nite_36890 [Actinoplanes derwentensis]SDT81143.1 VWA domain containing CoxE-like protein [Actinoplanes derwentensis]